MGASGGSADAKADATKESIEPDANGQPTQADPEQLDDDPVPLSCFTILGDAGKGSYSLVQRAYDNRAQPATQSRIVAIKTLYLSYGDSDEELRVAAMREVSLLRSVDHENVLRALGVAAGPIDENFHIIMECCGKDLAVLTEEDEVRLSVSEVKCLGWQLFQGLQYLHARNIIHRDIKPDNLLLTARGTLKIGDLGLARYHSTGSMTPGMVTLWYRAPELLVSAAEYTSAIDIWAAGVVIGELILGIPILPGETDADQLDLIAKLLGSPTDQDLQPLREAGYPCRGMQDLLVTWNLPDRFAEPGGKGIVAFLTGLLQWDANKRWTASGALQGHGEPAAEDRAAWWNEQPVMCREEELSFLSDWSYVYISSAPHKSSIVVIRFILSSAANSPRQETPSTA
ncbi:hypothetical protein LTR50_001587 [Elasticomyces elasticus]|nr:hypothetical protein LTR50_001587 [Elasticomyces elasticus]